MKEGSKVAAGKRENACEQSCDTGYTVLFHVPIIHDIPRVDTTKRTRPFPSFWCPRNLFSKGQFLKNKGVLQGIFVFFAGIFGYSKKVETIERNNFFIFLLKGKIHTRIFISARIFVYAYSVVGTFSGVPISHCMLNSNRRKTHGKKNR